MALADAITWPDVAFAAVFFFFFAVVLLALMMFLGDR